MRKIETLKPNTLQGPLFAASVLLSKLSLLLFIAGVAIFLILVVLSPESAFFAALFSLSGYEGGAVIAYWWLDNTIEFLGWGMLAALIFNIIGLFTKKVESEIIKKRKFKYFIRQLLIIFSVITYIVITKLYYLYNIIRHL